VAQGDKLKGRQCILLLCYFIMNLL